MGECSRCGECCRYMVIAKWLEVTTKDRHYLDCRAELKDGWYVVYAPCKYLIEGVPDTRCGVEDNKPEICRMFNGKQTRDRRFWIPKSCTMARP